MNRYDVVQTIKQVGNEFGRVMACLQSEEYSAGYRQAVKDMVRVFEYNAVAKKPRVKKIVLFGGTRGHRYECS